MSALLSVKSEKLCSRFLHKEHVAYGQSTGESIHFMPIAFRQERIYHQTWRHLNSTRVSKLQLLGYPITQVLIPLDTFADDNKKKVSKMMKI